MSSPESHVTFQSFFFFFNDTATTEIYTLSLHDALPIWAGGVTLDVGNHERSLKVTPISSVTSSPSAHPSIQEGPECWVPRSEEHTSELQSRLHLVCRLLLEKKNKTEYI